MPRPSIAVQIVMLAAMVFGALAVRAQAPLAGVEMTAWDRVVMESAFSRADVNDDGALSKVEVARLAAMAARFDELDSDHDGSLNLEEFAVGFAAPL